MADDSLIPPVDGVGGEQVERVTEWNRRRGQARGEETADELRRVEQSVPSDPGGDRRELLDDALELDEFDEDAAREPRAVEVAAEVHDAAVHGDLIARAIERARDGGSPRRGSR